MIAQSSNLQCCMPAIIYTQGTDGDNATKQTMILRVEHAKDMVEYHTAMTMTKSICPHAALSRT